MTTQSVPIPRTRADRCDRCGAAALIRARLRTGGELQFCGHHARVHARRLVQIGAGLSSNI